jgi:hypothetical protein
LAKWAVIVAPTAMPFIDPDMSLDMRSVAASEETTGSDEAEPLAVDLNGPLSYLGGGSTRPLSPRMSPRPRGTRFAVRLRRLVHK